MSDECWYLHPEGCCIFDKHCNFRDDDMKCTATDEDLITFAEFLKIRSSTPKVNEK